MVWDEERVRQRVANHDFSDLEVNVADLSRQMDFHRLGTKDVRRVHGAHLYADVSNFHQAVADVGGDVQRLKKLLRAASVLRRVQGDLLTAHEIGSLQLQAARLHCIVYKPYTIRGRTRDAGGHLCCEFEFLPLRCFQRRLP
jgi:hypothetical protein